MTGGPFVIQGVQSALYCRARFGALVLFSCQLHVDVCVFPGRRVPLMSRAPSTAVPPTNYRSD